MKIRAKFKCTSITTHEGGVEEARLSAVTAHSKENESWSKWTPNGELTMSITNENAHGAFAPGQEYFLDVTPVAAPEET